MTFDFIVSEDPKFLRILRSYSHLTNEELEREIKYRTSHPYDTRMVGASDCMVDSHVLYACRKILKERKRD